MSWYITLTYSAGKKKFRGSSLRDSQFNLIGFRNHSSLLRSIVCLFTLSSFLCLPFLAQISWEFRKADFRNDRSMQLHFGWITSEKMDVRVVSGRTVNANMQNSISLPGHKGLGIMGCLLFWGAYLLAARMIVFVTFHARKIAKKLQRSNFEGLESKRC